MRIYLTSLLIIVLCLGCDPAKESQQDDNSVHPIEDNSKNKDASASHEFTHVITTETEYYTTGPQQGRPPDGKFPAGTKVSIIEDAVSYVWVQSGGEIEAYVAADAVRQ